MFVMKTSNFFPILVTDVTQMPRIGASTLALTGEASFAFPILLSKQSFRLRSGQALTLPLWFFRVHA